MLVLKRFVHQSVMIGEDIKVTIVGARGDCVRIGVDAPRQVAVHREEIYERILREEGRLRSGVIERPVRSEDS